MEAISITGTQTYLRAPYGALRFSSLAVGSSVLFTDDAYGALTEFQLGQSQYYTSFTNQGRLIAASSTDQLYIAHRYGIDVYAPGSAQPLRTITEGVKVVAAMGIGPDDGLYISNSKNVVIYAGKSEHPSRTITTGIERAKLFAFDAAGQLLVYNAGSKMIAIYPHGASSPVRIIPRVEKPSWMTVGPTGTVYVVQHDEHLISEYDQEGRQLSRQVRGIEFPRIAIVDALNNLFVLSDGPGQGMWEALSGQISATKRLDINFPFHQDAWTVGPPW